MLRCAPCADADTSEHIFQATATPVSSQGMCMTLCNPEMHTLLNGVRIETYAPLTDIVCEPCATRPDLTCGSNCSLDRFRNGSECVLCNVEPCTQNTFFREPCSGETDSVCLPCHPSLLYNPPLSAALQERSDDLAIELQNLVNITTRRWQPDTTTCAVVCINNFVWIDALTGRFASNVLRFASVACIPCDSHYVKTHLLFTSRMLYSVWNSTNTTADTVPIDGSLERGSCFYCPAGHNTLSYGSDVMCESMPGYTFEGQGSSGTAHVGDMMGNNTIAPSTPDQGYSRKTFDRRLLQAAQNTTSQTKTILVRRQPIIASQTSFFQCCSKSTQTYMTNCRSLNLKNLEIKKELTRNSFGQDFCDDSGNSTQPPPTPEITACFSGTFKPERGAGACYVCPSGASTFSDSSTSYSDCRCLHGYRSLRSRDGFLQSCTPCGQDWFRSPLQQNDSYCLPCPPNTHTPTTSSGHCYCYAGFYMLKNGTCTPCEQGFYCGADNNRTACPLHSTTLGLASTTRGDCLCLSPIYFGDLSINASTECIYVKPGHNCSLQFSSSLCPCSLGWLPRNQGCVSSCPPGAYAMLGAQQSIEHCVPCPIDTYADTNETVHIPMLPLARQCTPCPPNTHTVGTGSVSCACVGVQNGSRCQMCAADQYFIPATRTCNACPPGTKSPMSSIGINSCLCPRGYLASRQTIETHQTLLCEPCPRGYFSSNLGSSCTPCPWGLSTTVTGATSRLQCS